ncbi:putative sugar ABC transporter membrane protein [Escherichia coli]|nr:putative sugar ABC transporter membrane protein [Escherichia coli]
MPQSLPDTTTPKRRFRWPTGMPQLVALLLVLLVDSLVARISGRWCFRMGVCSVAP